MNKKYIFIGIGIISVVIITISVMIICNKTKITYTTLKSTNSKFSVDIPSNINYEFTSEQNSDFTIDLYSLKDEMYIYASSIEKTRTLDLLQIVQDDKSLYISNKENITNDSGISEVIIKDYKAYEYSIQYYDKEYGKNFYSNVVWIETSTDIYILNFEVVSTNADKYKDIFSNIKNSFVEL